MRLGRSRATLRTMLDDTIAKVVLRTTIRGHSMVLHYRVPSRLRGHVAPGQLVWAPLRHQQVQGIVLALESHSGVTGSDMRDLLDLADPEACILPLGLTLAQWVARTYHVPLYEVLALLLPPGVTQDADTTWRTTAAGLTVELGTLPERERAILYYLRTHGESSERELRRELRGRDSELREAYALLRERGLLIRGTARSAPRARPRRVRMARLCVVAERQTALIDQIAHAPKQQAVLRWLFERLSVAEVPQAAPAPPVAVHEIYAATGSNLAVLRALEQKGWLALETHEVRRDPLLGNGVLADVPPPLTAGQERVWRPIAAALEAAASALPPADLPSGSASPPTPAAAVFLLHGVTGSGKTEVYLRAIGRTLRLGRQALVLVPEIALTTQLVRRFAARFPGQLAVLHSGLALGERYDEWRRLRRGEARLAIGSRSAVFAPLPSLGLIIVDEEHEPAFKHESSPRYHARDVAWHLAALSGSVLILGSATPSIESYYAARTGRCTLLEMTERVGAMPAADGLPRSQTLPLPAVRLVDMRQELQSGNRSIFSRPLQHAIGTALERQEQVILFLNRRGAATFVMCRDCGATLNCPDCNIPLVLHYDGEGDPAQTAARVADSAVPAVAVQPALLICHACGHRELLPTVCPQCLSPRIKAFGVGTQRVEAEVQHLFPGARTLRWDRDSISGKGAHSRLLDQFLRHEADVLIGTQMIAKGLDLPLVSVVGMVAADTGLHLPDFRSGERSFQLLTQVAGRAGRRVAGAQVIIQTYNPEHYALRAAQEHDYHAFYVQEIGFRRQTAYPPFARLVRFVYTGRSEATCEQVAGQLATHIRTTAERLHWHDWSLIGPAPAFVQRKRGRWRWHLILRAADPLPLLHALGPLRGWVVDVDPVSVL